MNKKNIASILMEARNEEKINLAEAFAVISAIRYVSKMYDTEAQDFIRVYGFDAYLQLKEFNIE
jgi:hypothetical protein